MRQPLVSVICLCHNHARFVRQALDSVWMQTYPNVELLVVDDASTDGSAEVIRRFAAENPAVRVFFNEENRGNCRSFNQAFRQSRGEFIIDLAADDVLGPDRIARQVAGFSGADQRVGVLFHNAVLINADGRRTGTFFPVDQNAKATVAVPEGDLFAELLRHRPVCAPTMMVRRAVLDGLGGYDERLAYEDFDFWVRSARTWHYAYQDELLTEKRGLPSSLGSRFYAIGNALLPSALLVCRKASALCQTPDERAALRFRVRYFVRQCWYTHHFGLAQDFAAVLENPDLPTQLVLWACRWRVRVHSAYRRYLWLRMKTKQNRNG